MRKLRLAYFGTPYFAADFLEKLLTDKDLPVEVTLVVTQPDKKKGRKQLLTASPTKIVATKYNISVYDKQSKDELKQALKGIDLAILLFYGKIIPPDVLELPKEGFWNIHFSSLPQYRGGLPHAFALINGDVKCGVTLFKMDEKLDHGPIISQTTTLINQSERRPDLEKKCTAIGFELLKKALQQLAEGTISLKEQDHTQATYTKLLKREDGFISIENLKLKIEKSPEELFNLFRGLFPWPGIWTLIRVKGEGLRGKEKRLKITDMDFDGKKLTIKKVQLEGKNEVDFETFKKAYGWDS